jgi:hypothetical protein
VLERSIFLRLLQRLPCLLSVCSPHAVFSILLIAKAKEAWQGPRAEKSFSQIAETFRSERFTSATEKLFPKAASERQPAVEEPHAGRETGRIS